MGHGMIGLVLLLSVDSLCSPYGQPVAVCLPHFVRPAGSLWLAIFASLRFASLGCPRSCGIANPSGNVPCWRSVLNVQRSMFNVPPPGRRLGRSCAKCPASSHPPFARLPDPWAFAVTPRPRRVGNFGEGGSSQVGTARAKPSQPTCRRQRASVLDCVRQAWALPRFRRPDVVLRPQPILHPTKAVSPMQACAVHLCHRTPRRWRVILPPPLPKESSSTLPWQAVIS